MQKDLIFKDESFKIMGACFDVYKTMGCGFLEAVYQECLEEELKLKNIPFTSQKEIILNYKGKILTQKYRPDFICFGKIIVGIKAISNIVDEHKARILNYLNATKYKLGILVNFGHSPKLEYKRMVL